MNYAGIELREIEGKHYFQDLEVAGKYEARFRIHENHTPLIGRLWAAQRRGWRESKRRAWMGLNGLRPCRTRFHPLWMRALPSGHRKVSGYAWVGPREAHRVMGEWHVCDHDEIFYGSGRGYVYTTQPYDLSIEQFTAIESYWVGLGLFVTISIDDAWWYPGKTPLLAISQFALAQETP